jgi:HEPN domain-containing protein
MTRKRLPPKDPREWLARAKSNLALARNVIPEVDLEDFCFDAQQCAEKAIKAIFVGRGETFPFIHDLEELLGLLRRNGVKVPKYILAAEELSQYAAKTRYPGMADPVTQREYKRAVRIATAVLRWAERQVAALRAQAKGK